ncbi:MMPL family transporter [Streptomyces scabiei]|uniref:MMPL family transporter n=1 Tax=Streptomyces scabiei TaxID=1930 RepID=UPI001B31290C|nr:MULTISPECIES: MMPL family transporter [Streptomyces]MBP5877147.1 MMPL family transporter [Streptomyces sp. LBUM 1477]MBP5884934.1 MMPL family transporter [Streptomyces sp. LBUM 1487]MDW8474418.1 MMPL family transporter [Streptomyces scabiei]MDX2572645.1 MMPL family transporter [Streptomyces scabiei]MDX2632353.1 MMPL family transporter [Streptomyces scabiei]
MLSKALLRLGAGAARHPWRVIAAWLVATTLAVLAAVAFGGRTADSMTAPGLDSQKAAELIGRARTGQEGMTAQVVVTPRDGAATFFDRGGARTALTRLRAEVERLPHVLGTSDPAGALDARGDAAVRGGLVSADGRIAVVRVQYPDQSRLSAEDLDALVGLGDRLRAELPLRIEMGGNLFYAFSDPDGGASELIGLLAAAAILFLAFGSLVAAALPIGMAVFGLTVGVATMTLLAGVTDVPTFAPVLGSMVGLGVGIDYALFVLARHREYLAGGLDPRTAAGRAVATAGRPVVFAGGTVVVSILGLAVANVPFMTVGGVAVSIVVLIMVLASVTLLPAFLGAAGPRLARAGRIGRALRAGRRRDVAAGAAPAAGWRRWIGHVGRHPVPYAVGAAGLLLTATLPVLGLRVGLPDDGSLPPGRTERRAYDLVAEGFGPGTNGPLVVAADPAGDPGVLDRLVGAVAADPGIASVAPAHVDRATGIATLVVFPATGPQDRATADTIARLRTDVLPTAIGQGPARAHVGGAAASLSDVGQRTSERLPAFVAAVLAMSFLLLMLVFRSVLVPLKAVLLNLLSIGAAYGVMVAVFQWGWGGALIGLEATVPIVSFIPMFLFAILFGLSMDYEVFLLSRVREEYLRTGDNGTAIVEGVSRTARIITSAALIMVAVFLSFAVADDPSTKMFGLGLATAILIDATVVRMVLVPATMTLLGRANWWLPKWLDRMLPRGPVGTADTGGTDAEATGEAPRPRLVDR